MEVGLGPGHIVLDGGPAPPQKRRHSPLFSTHVICAQMPEWIKMPLGMEVGLDPSDIVLDGDPAPPPQKGDGPPVFGPYLLWPNGCMDQDASWYRGRPRPRSHCARWKLSSSFSKRGHSPQFSAHVCWHQTAGWIKMPLGTKVGLGPGRILLHGDPAPPPKRGTAPIFGP